MNESNTNKENNNKAGTIIAATTFRTDVKKENALIFWLGTKMTIPMEYVDDLSSKFQQFYQDIGLSSFLIAKVIKYCAVSNQKIDLYLQVSLDSDNALFFYHRKGFSCIYNDVTEPPNT